MRIPLSWLREFVPVPVEPKRLGEDLTLAGFALESLEAFGEDAILDLEITTNRVDCMNVYGIAREVSVLYGVSLRPLDLSFREWGPPAEQSLEVVVEAPDLCPRFCACVLDLRLGPSPPWIQERLEAVGVRPINNLVDLTNYVMMEMGQPSHAFDLNRIPGGCLRVRWARDGERLETLDGTERLLAGRIGVVAGREEPLALAGIMGGASSEVSEATRVAVLEAAYWEPLAIRRAAKALGMHTEASHRFERGTDPEATVLATARLAHLLERTGAGTIRPGLIDRVAAVPGRRRITLRPSRVSLLLGATVPEQEAARILSGLGFRVRGRDGEGMDVEVPTWRGDVSREVDLIEEVGRHHGLGKIPSTVPPVRGAEGLRPWQARERAVREVLVGAGLTEAINYAFVSEGVSSQPALRIANPLAEDQSVLRNSLVVPGLLQTLHTNLRQGRRDVRLFEMGRVFFPDAERALEERRLAILLTGAARPRDWSETPRPADFYDLKGILETLSRGVGLGELEFSSRPPLPAVLHPGKAALVLWKGEVLGHLGALHPELAEAWELREEALVAEVKLDGVLLGSGEPVRFRALPRFPGVARDLSIVCDAQLPAAEVEAVIRTAAGENLRELSFVDRYEGPPVPSGKVSLTVTLTFQDPGRTLTGEEVQAALERVVAGLHARGAEIRRG